MKYYIEHYFDLSRAGSFLLVAFLGLISILAIILITARIQTKYHGKKDALTMDTCEIRLVRKVHHSLLESFYEMVFSSTAVLLFLSLYYILDEYASPISGIWFRYQNIILLVFIMFSTILTSWFDVAFVKLRHINSDQKAIIRLLSSFYIILILIYIKFIYQDDNYDQLIIYFLLLAAGRFLYFDTTLKWLKEILTELARNLPLLGLMAFYSGIVCLYGFKSGFLLKSNGVIVSTLIAHLFMDLAIFILAKTGIIKLFLPKEDDTMKRKLESILLEKY